MALSVCYCLCCWTQNLHYANSGKNYYSVIVLLRIKHTCYLLKKTFLLLDEIGYINNKPLNAEEIKPHHMNSFKSNIEFKGVTVKWPGSSVQVNDQVLSDISFTVFSCQIVTIVGHVASGKVSSLSHFYLQLRFVFNTNLVWDFFTLLSKTVSGLMLKHVLS